MCERHALSHRFFQLFLTVLLICSLRGTPCLFAQSSYSANSFQITTLDRLAQNTINFITQDQDGFIWYGTQTSLERFDGDPDYLAQWYVSEYKAKGYVKAVKTLPNKVLIGTHDGMLMLLDNRLSNPKDRNFGILNTNLGNILQINSLDGYYLVVSKKGLFLLTSDGKISTTYTFSPTQKVECAVIEKNMVFVGTTDSLLKFTISNNTISSPQAKSTDTPPNCFLPINDTLWIGRKDGSIRAIGIRTFQFLNVIKRYSTQPITTLLMTSSGELWVGTEGDGIHILDPKTLEERDKIRREQELSSNFISYLFEATDKTIFIGTSGGGLCRYYSRRIFRHLFTYDSVNNFLWSLYCLRDDRYLLAGTKGAGIRIIDIETGKDVTRRAQNIDPKSASMTINCIIKFGEAYLLGTDAGIYKLTLTAQFPPSYHTEPYRIKGLHLDDKAIAKLLYVPDKHRLFIGNRTDRKIIMVNGFAYNPVATDHDVSGPFINAINDIPQQNALLVGTDNGLNLFGYENNKLIKYSSPLDSLVSGKPIMSILEDNSKFYASTRTGEILIWDKNNVNNFLSKVGNSGNDKNGLLLPSALYGLQKDQKGFIWISSNTGFFRLDPNNSNILDHYKNNKTITQLEFNRGAYCRSEDGSKLYFGGPDGILEVDTKQVENPDPDRKPRFFEITYYVKGDKTVMIQRAEDDIQLPNNVDYVELRPLYLYYNENLNHYVTFFANQDTLNKPFSPEALLNDYRFYLNRIGLPVSVSVKTIYREGLKNPDIDNTKIRFGSDPLRVVMYGLIFLILVSFFYWLAKRTSVKSSLISSINKISSTYGCEQLLDAAIGQLLDHFNFDYAIISLIDYKNKKITSTKYRAAKESKLFWGKIRLKNPLIDKIGEWAKASDYTLGEDDILCRMLDNASQPVWFVGKASDNKSLKYNNLNIEIYKKYEHKRFSRFFIPMVDRTNILGEAGEQMHAFSIGVIEAGYKRSWFRLGIDYLYFFIYRLVSLLFNNRINIQPVKFDLQLLADNLSQTYLQFFLKEETQNMEVKIKNINNANYGLDEYWDRVLADIAGYTNSMFAKIDVLTFNDEALNLKEAFIAYPREQRQKIKDLLEQGYKSERNKGKIGISRQVMRTNTFYVSSDVRKDPYYIELFGTVQSEMGIPIYYNDEIVAVLILSSIQPNTYSPVQVAIIKSIINDVWAISLSKRRVIALESISSPNYNIAAESTARIYYPVVEALASYFRSDFISVWEKEELSDKMFVLSHQAMVSEVFYAMYETSKLLRSPISEIQHDSEQPVVFIVTRDTPKGKSIQAFFEEYHFQQYIAIRIVVEGRYEGFINIFSRREVKLSADDYLFLTQISNYLAASVIANKLFKAFRDLSESFNKGKEMYQKLVNHAKELSRADLVSFFPLVNGKYILKEGVHSQHSGTSDFTEVEGRANLPRVILKIGDQFISNEQHYISVLEEDLGRKFKQEDIQRTFWKRFGNRSVAAIRLTLNDENLGVIFFNYKTPKDFNISSPTKQIIDIFSNFAKILILNYNIIEKIQEETVKLQHEGEVYARLTRNYQRLISQNQEKIEELEKITEQYRDLVIARSFYSMVDGLLHECKNYLFFLVNKLSRLEREGSAGAIEQEVKKVRMYAQSISGILNIFNIRTEHVESLDLLNIIRTIMNFFKSFGENTDVTFEIEEDKPVRMSGNQTEISLIFHNLIANAITAIEKVKSQKPQFNGKISVFFKETGNYLTVGVRDNGSGIDAQYLPDKIFKRGFSTKTDPETNTVIGTGIGLSYVKEILEERYNSEIKCQSKVGDGTTFLIVFPKYKIK